MLEYFSSSPLTNVSLISRLRDLKLEEQDHIGVFQVEFSPSLISHSTPSRVLRSTCGNTASTPQHPTPAKSTRSGMNSEAAIEVGKKTQHGTPTRSPSVCSFISYSLECASNEILYFYFKLFNT